MKIAYETLASTLRHRRESCGFGLRELAELVDISPTYLSRIETGKEVAVSEGVLNSLAAHLGLNADELCALSGRVPLDVMTLLVDTPGAIAMVRQLLAPRSVKLEKRTAWTHANEEPQSARVGRGSPTSRNTQRKARLRSTAGGA